jgi:hypothetical protein
MENDGSGANIGSNDFAHQRWPSETAGLIAH